MANQSISKVFDAIEAELAKSFDTIATKYGYHLSFKAGSYSPGGSNLTLKIEAVKDGAQSHDAQVYEAQRVFLGLPPLKYSLQYGDKKYEIAGINKTGTKVLGKSSANGKIYLLPVALVKQLYSIQKGA
jgi:hypothetical protein